jgi:transcription elongation factor Elf1
VSDRRRHLSAATREGMKRSAKARTCPKCRRRSAMSRIEVADGVGHRCRWCGYERFTSMWPGMGEPIHLLLTERDELLRVAQCGEVEVTEWGERLNFTIDRNDVECDECRSWFDAASGEGSGKAMSTADELALRRVGWWCAEHGVHTDREHERGARCLLRPPGCQPVVIDGACETGKTG